MGDGDGGLPEWAGEGTGEYLGCERRKVNFLCDMFRWRRQDNWQALRFTLAAGGEEG
jgi:hypothetical protein